LIEYKPIIQGIQSNILDAADISADVLRLDLIHPSVSGNKWFKLKKNLEKAAADGQETLITFGGAYSNHIAATATACKMAGIKSIGVIRGERPEELNQTLSQAIKEGMHLHFVDRRTYSEKDSEDFKLFLEKTFGKHYLVPEGGNNSLGALGCAEIIDPAWNYNVVFCACGTATTYAGIAGSVDTSIKVVGISVLKGDNELPEDASAMIKSAFEKNIAIYGNEEMQKPEIINHCITNRYGFNGYAKFDDQLLEFKKTFELQNQVPLDHVYTTKLFYGFFDLVRQDKFKKGSRVLLIHSGGLQGNTGFESRYKIH